MIITSIEKDLSANDTGETGAHQAGILVPKDPSILGFFPPLGKAVKNPRVPIDAFDDAGHEWTFKFIYYNNRLFGGTRNEYRLTGMTAFFRRFDLRAGDTLIFRRVSNHRLNVSYRRANQGQQVIRLSTGWKVIEANL